MWNWKPTWLEALLLLIAVIVSTISCFPCWLLQKTGIKSKLYAKLLCNIGLDQFSYLEIIEYKI